MYRKERTKGSQRNKQQCIKEETKESKTIRAWCRARKEQKGVRETRNSLEEGRIESE